MLYSTITRDEVQSRSVKRLAWRKLVHVTHRRKVQKEQNISSSIQDITSKI